MNSQIAEEVFRLNLTSHFIDPWKSPSEEQSAFNTAEEIPLVSVNARSVGTFSLSDRGIAKHLVEINSHPTPNRYMVRTTYMASMNVCTAILLLKFWRIFYQG